MMENIGTWDIRIKKHLQAECKKGTHRNGGYDGKYLEGECKDEKHRTEEHNNGNIGKGNIMNEGRGI